MPEFTTIKVSTRTRDSLRVLADRDGRTLDAEIEALVGRERRRIIGQQLSAAALSADEVAVLNASASDVDNACR
jgi:ABC-type antimicrobial peptide transport system ATPase subunit